MAVLIELIYTDSVQSPAATALASTLSKACMFVGIEEPHGQASCGEDAQLGSAGNCLISHGAAISLRNCRSCERLLHLRHRADLLGIRLKQSVRDLLVECLLDARREGHAVDDVADRCGFICIQAFAATDLGLQVLSMCLQDRVVITFIQ